MKYQVGGKVKNIIVWYSKNWYKSTGNIVEDFKIILKDVYYTNDWSEVDVASILIHNFPEVIKDNMREIISESIYNSRYFFEEENKFDSKVQFLKSIKSVIGLLEIQYLEGLDEQYKELYNLKKEE